jgi:organic hydroperoxide reductase OsmC/OhrA
MAHSFRASLEWTGATSSPTYSRDHVIRMAGKPDLLGSADKQFRGSAARHNPEELLVAALSSCHLLSYLYLCSRAGISVTRYVDEAEASLKMEGASGRFERAVLRPRVTIAKGGDGAKAKELHHEAHRLCFVANSVNFPVDCEPVIELATA